MSSRQFWLAGFRAKTIRKTSLRLNCSPLEARLTPTNDFLGPMFADQLQQMERFGLTAYTPLTAIPASSTGATSYLQLADFAALSIDTTALKARLDAAPAEYDAAPTVIALPRPDGTFARFKLWEVQLMAPALAAEFPDISTYRGQGIDDPTALLAADLTPQGFHAQVLSAQGSYYVDPYYHLSDSVYASYFMHDNLKQPGDGCSCALCTASGDAISPSGPGGLELFGPNISYGGTLRTLRTAVAATGEYTAFQGGTVALGQAGIVTSVNRVSGVYEKEVAVRLQLVANNSSLVYTNSATDPYTNDSGSTMLGQNQTNIDSVIQNANYDLGHVFSTAGGGVAGLGVVGISGSKARGVTGQSAPVGDSFDIDYVAHEMGHQFDGNHSWNAPGNNNINPSTAYEVGSGSTIMSYAGIIAGNNVQSNSDAYFHAVSLGEIVNNLATIPSVGTTTANGNLVPIANAGANFTIPANTPFALTGSATDGNGDALTYCWEQYDLGPATTLGVYSATAPLFRSITGTTSPTRTFPALPSLLSNIPSVNEVMPTGARNLNFTLTVRDNRSGGGAVDMDDTLLTVAASTGFLVTAPNSAVSWAGGSAQTITWDVAATSIAPINTGNVRILLSTDGGNTFPTILSAGTANDGSEAITIPNLPTSQARIKVEAVGNIFFDISNVNFTIAPGSAMQVNSTSPGLGGVLAGPTATLDLNFTQPISVATLSAGDLSVSVGTVTGVTIPAGLPNTARFTIGNLTAEATLTATLATGAVSSTTGNTTDAFNGTYGVDVSTVPFTGAFTALAPLGSRVYTASMIGTVNAAGDEDTYTLDLDAGQNFSVAVIPTGGLQPVVTVTGPSTNQSGSSTTAAKPVFLTRSGTTTAGNFSFKVGGTGSGVVGAYTLQIRLNAAPEAETLGGAANNSIATAQNIDAALSPLGTGAALGSIVGSFDGGAASNETEPNATTATATNLANSFGSYTGNLYHLGLTGALSSTSDQDYFNIGILQAGDVITITQMGAGAGNGTLGDPQVYLYRAGTTGPVISSDDEGTGSDSLIYRYVVPTTDTYSIRAETFNNSTSGTYALGVQLENTGTAPTTGGTTFTESAATNDTKPTAQNVSSSWQAVSHSATTTGNVSVATDVDVFAYAFAAGDLVSINARSTSTLDARVRLLNSAGTALAIEDGASDGPNLDSPLYAYRIATAGTYYVEVTAAAGTGTYALDLFLTAAVAPPVPIDFYAISLITGQTLTMSLKGQTAGSYGLELLNNLGAVVATGTATATNFDSLLSFTPTGASTFYARVSGNTSAAYVLTAGLGVALDAEPNDAFATALPLGTRTRAVGALVAGNADFYSIDLTAGNLFTLSTNTPGDGVGQFGNLLDPRIEIYSPAGTLLASNANSAADGRNAIASLPINASGAYVVAILNESGLGGEYGLVLSQAPNTLQVLGFTINNALSQRSRLTTIKVEFTQNVSPAAFTAPGAIVLTRYAATSQGIVGTIVQTGASGANGLINVAQGAANELLLTFANGDGGLASDGVEYGSLADGRWRLTIPTAASYENPLGVGDPIIRRLFGDNDNSGLVDGVDYGNFGTTFGVGTISPIFNAAYDFNGSGDIDGSIDLAEFGNRFGLTL